MATLDFTTKPLALFDVENGLRSLPIAFDAHRNSVKGSELGPGSSRYLKGIKL